MIDLEEERRFRRDFVYGIAVGMVEKQFADTGHNYKITAPHGDFLRWRVLMWSSPNTLVMTMNMDSLLIRVYRRKHLVANNLLYTTYPYDVLQYRNDDKSTFVGLEFDVKMACRIAADRNQVVCS